MGPSPDLKVMIAMFALLIIWVLIPLVPAILIYRLFPDTKVSLTGPLSNLTLRATGAFAAYAVVLLIAFFLVQPMHNKICGMSDEVWRVNAHVRIIDESGQPVSGQDLFESMTVEVSPDLFHVTQDSVKLTLPKDSRGWPDLVFHIPDFGGATVNLETEKSNLEIDRGERIVTLRTPVTIREFPAAGISSRPDASGPRGGP